MTAVEQEERGAKTLTFSCFLCTLVSASVTVVASALLLQLMSKLSRRHRNAPTILKAFVAAGTAPCQPAIEPGQPGIL